MIFSTKTYTHAEGLSCCFRQWRAESHCRFLHGYAIQVQVTFVADELDERNWVVDFGGLKDLKQYLQNTFDHKTLVALDDPKLFELKGLDAIGLIQLVEVEHVGCEAFAQMIFDWIHENIMPKYPHAMVSSVEVREHAGNSAIYTSE